MERIDEAMRAFAHTLTLDPNYPLAHFNLARLYNLRGDAKRALEHAQAAVRTDERMVEGWLLVGDIHRRSRETQPALAAYAMAMRADPGSLKARNVHAEMLAEVGLVDEARRAYRQVEAQAPGNFKAALGANLSAAAALRQRGASRGHAPRLRARPGAAARGRAAVPLRQRGA